MTPISRGFGGRRRDDVDPSRLPPLQGAGGEARSWTRDEFTALPAEDVTVDIHCVTKWSKLDTR
jgi:DMSO/TMAO reductase YedYZ molybdopterin-dependent catalytic subunit